MTTQLTEKDFVSNFLTLATIEPFKRGKDYFKPYEQVEQLGVALPALPCKKYKYSPARSALAGSLGGNQGTDGEASFVEISLKSVRPPKFNVSKKFSTNQSIHNVKEFLIQEVGELVETQQLKVLLKGKVLQDSYILSDLNTDTASLTVMVSKPTQSPSPSVAVDDDDFSPPIVPAGSELSVDMPWLEIKNLLQKKFGSDADKHLERLQKGWELTK